MEYGIGIEELPELKEGFWGEPNGLEQVGYFFVGSAHACDQLSEHVIER